MNELSEYTGPVVCLGAIDKPIKGFAWLCHKCLSAPISFNPEVTTTERVDPIYIKSAVRFQNDQTGQCVEIYMGRCEKCGTVYQTWRPYTHFPPRR